MNALRPFWHYYGGKWRAAPHYPAPRFETIIEPFAGAAGYSLRYPTRRVILIERFAPIAAIWRWLIQASPDEVRSIPCVEAVADLPAWVPLGARALVGFNLNSATTAPRNVLSAGQKRQAAKGRIRVGWNAAQRDMVANQVGAIKHWQIVEGDYSIAPDTAATWFVDPPYANRAGSLYPEQPHSYDDLGSWCRGRRGQVIVCENEGAAWLPFRPFRAIRSWSGQSREAIWTND